jgi:predicted O-linked N-acetylglucosamine transferase (SPINDLY family)
VRAVVERRLREAGLPQSRVELLERTLSQQEHLALYNQVDVALDTWPYNGTTTTCEALWMGVPVVTLAGDRHASRVGESLLRAVGQQAWVATSEDAYVELCASLATAPASKDAVRSELREALKGSLLLDHPGQAARFFSALRQAWVAWCA